jgi:hypothetical protein
VKRLMISVELVIPVVSILFVGSMCSYFLGPSSPTNDHLITSFNKVGNPLFDEICS